MFELKKNPNTHSKHIIYYDKTPQEKPPPKSHMQLIIFNL